MIHNTIPVGDDVRRLTLVIFFCLLSSALCPLPASAAQQAWIAKYNNGPLSTNEAKAMTFDPFGNIIVAGSSTSSSNRLDYVTIKYSATGTELWARRYTSPGTF